MQGRGRSPAVTGAVLDDLTNRRTLYRAFDRVADNGGCRGADGVTLGAFRRDLERELDSIQDSLLTRRYHPLPLLEIAIPKKTVGERLLRIPAVRDRVVQSAAYLLTRDRFEAEFEASSHGYREGRSVKTAVLQIRELRDLGYRHVVDADIDDFFESISHHRLLARLEGLGFEPYLLELFERWVRVEVYDGRSVVALTQGIPQGSVVSPMLANLFLDELDERLASQGLASVRYGDDFLVLVRSPQRAAQALEITDELLEGLELELDRDKTKLTSFEAGFKFLGAIFVGEAIYKPFTTERKERASPHLPPPLDLRRYLELRHPPVASGRRPP